MFTLTAIVNDFFQKDQKKKHQKMFKNRSIPSLASWRWRYITTSYSLTTNVIVSLFSLTIMALMSDYLR